VVHIGTILVRIFVILVILAKSFNFFGAKLFCRNWQSLSHVHKFKPFMGHEFRHRAHKTQAQDSALTEVNPVHIHLSYSLKIDIIMILPSICSLLCALLPIDFLIDILYVFLILRIHTSCSVFPIQFDLTKLRGLSPRANYTYRATADCRRS
jgi:hypothetical protein